MRNKNEKNNMKTLKLDFINARSYIIGLTCTYQNYLEEPSTPPRETSERMNFNVIDKKND
jgi:hypothetical protein